eukprot:355174_1
MATITLSIIASLLTTPPTLYSLKHLPELQNGLIIAITIGDAYQSLWIWSSILLFYYHAPNSSYVCTSIGFIGQIMVLLSAACRFVNSVKMHGPNYIEQGIDDKMRYIWMLITILLIICGLGPLWCGSIGRMEEDPSLCWVVDSKSMLFLYIPFSIYASWNIGLFIYLLKQGKIKAKNVFDLMIFDILPFALRYHRITGKFNSSLELKGYWYIIKWMHTISLSCVSWANLTFMFQKHQIQQSNLIEVSSSSSNRSIMTFDHSHISISGQHVTPFEASSSESNNSYLERGIYSSDTSNTDESSDDEEDLSYSNYSYSHHSSKSCIPVLIYDVFIFETN